MAQFGFGYNFHDLKYFRFEFLFRFLEFNISLRASFKK